MHEPRNTNNYNDRNHFNSISQIHQWNNKRFDHSYARKQSRFKKEYHPSITFDQYGPSTTTDDTTISSVIDSKKVKPSVSTDTVGVSHAYNTACKQIVSRSPKRNKLNSTSHGINTDEMFSTTIQSAKATGR